jgi:hypothetical protein
MTAPHGHDLQDSSCINKEIQVYYRKLHKMLMDVHHVIVIYMNLVGNEFTLHGLHLNSSGKEKIAKIIGHNITNPLTWQNPPIIVKWKEVPTTTSIDEAVMEFISENADDLHKSAVRTLSRSKRMLVTRNEDFLWSMNSSKTV